MKHSFNTVTIISYAFSPAMNKSLHAALETVYTSEGDPLSPLLKRTTSASLCSHPLFGLLQCSASISECQWMQFLPRGGTHRHTFASYTLPCQTPFCQTSPLLPSVTWQQNIIEYWQEGSTSTAIPPTSASDTVCQHNKIGGITFKAALVLKEILVRIVKC